MIHTSSFVDNTHVSQLLKKVTDEERERLKQYLIHCSPYQFEHIVKDLLIAMGYKKVHVTPRTHDKGVDVTGIIENGITTVREVIQVKRNTTRNIPRTDLDNLRGCLHRFDAFQGTIITLTDFTKGAKDAAIEKGAAPLTLINGEIFINLLIRHEVGICKKNFSYYMVDERYFEIGR